MSNGNAQQLDQEILEAQRFLNLTPSGAIIAQDGDEDPDVARARAFLGMDASPLQPGKEEELGIDRVGRFVESLASTAFALTPSGTALGLAFPGLRARGQMGASAAAASGIIRPAASLLELPEALKNHINKDADIPLSLFTKSSEFLRTSADMYDKAAEQVGQGIGLTDEQIRDINLSGDIIGFVAPAVASWKMAGYLTFANNRRAYAVALRESRRLGIPAPGKGGPLFVGNVIQDAAAGAVWGVAFEEGDLPERLGIAETQAGLAGAFGVMIGSGRLAFRGYRLMRLVMGKDTAALRKAVMESKDPLRGVITLSNLDSETAKAINRHMTEEYFMSQTEGGIRLATEAVNLNAVIQGVRDIAEGQATHGIIRDVVNGHFLEELVAAAKREFPELTVTPVLRKGGKSADVIFGRGGLSNIQMSEFRAMRDKFGDLAMFPGQHFRKGNTEYMFLGRPVDKMDQPIGSMIRVKRLTDGEITKVRMDKKVTPLMSSTPEIPGAVYGAAMNDYIRWLDDKFDQVLKARSSPGMQALDEIDPQGSTLRDFTTPDGIVAQPGEAGLPPNGRPFLIEYDVPLPATPFAREIREAMVMGESIDLIPLPDGSFLVELAGSEVGRVTQDQGMRLISGMQLQPVDALSGRYSRLGVTPDSASITRSAKREGRFQLTFYRTDADGALVPTGHLSHPTLDTLMAEAQRAGMVPRSPETVDLILQGFDQREMLRQGLGDVLDPLERFDHSTLVDLWAVERGIPPAEPLVSPGTLAKLDQRAKDIGDQLAREKISPKLQQDLLAELKMVRELRAKPPVDLEHFKVQVAERLRQRALDSLDPAERAVYKKLQNKLQEFHENTPVDLKFQAAANGFYSTKLEDGRVLLRDIDSGTPIIYQGEQAAIDGLQFAARDRRSFLDGYGLPPTGGGGDYMGGITGGDVPDGEALEWLIPGVGLDTKVDSKALNRALRLINRKPRYTVLGEALSAIESGTGLRIWSQGFRPLLQAVEVMDARTQEYMQLVSDMFHGYSKREVLHLFDYMRRIEGQNLSTKELRAIQQEMDIGPRLLSLRAEYRKLFDHGFEIATGLGLSPRDYITDYVSRIRPMYETGFKSNDELFAALERGGRLTKKDRAWFLKTRTGNLSQVEQDLRLIAIKYFRELMFETHVAPTWNRLFEYVEQYQHGPLKGTLKNPLGLNSLDDAARERVVEQLGGKGSVEVLVNMFEDVLNGVKGTSPRTDAVANLLGGVLKNAGVQVDDEVMRTMMNLAVANMYGQAMGFRMKTIVRDSLQTYWFLLARLGPKHFMNALKLAITPQGFAEARAAGALQLRTSGIELGDMLFESAVDNLPIKVEGRVIGPATASALRAGGWMAKKGRGLSRLGLTGFSSLDEIMRSHAYWFQKLHTLDWVDQTGLDGLVKSGLSRDQLLENPAVKKFLDEGLPFYEYSKKLEFLRQYMGLGQEEALRYIGAQGANETHFVYKMMNQLGWIQTSWGRLVNMFGNWPMNAREVYYRTIRNGTPTQRARFALRTGTVMGAVGLLAYETGTNLWSWVSPIAWMNYFGGPFVDQIADVGDIVAGSHLERSKAIRNVATKWPFMAIPGYRALMDVEQIVNQSESPEHGIYIWGLGRPQRPGPHYTMQYLMNPNEDVVPATFRNLAEARRRRTMQSQMLELPASARPLAPKSTLQDALRQQGVTPLPAAAPGGPAPQSTPGRPLTPGEAFGPGAPGRQSQSGPAPQRP